MERVLACTADAIHVLQYCKGPPQQSHNDYWRDSFGAKTNRIEDVIAWAELPRPFIYPLGNSSKHACATLGMASLASRP